jgi:hypothetical protein
MANIRDAITGVREVLEEDGRHPGNIQMLDIAV